MERKTVAIIGAGPAGLVAARWLAAKGVEPTLFEASDAIGGQWNADNPASATWTGMVTNTSRVMTAFSDLEHPEGTPIYPSREAVGSYLDAYATRFDLHRRVTLRATVSEIGRSPQGGWTVAWTNADGARQGKFDYVLVATGRQSTPSTPDVPGLASFAGRFGVGHTRDYRGGAAYCGARVLLGGCSISALEIASDLAARGVDVTVAYRRQRYVLPKLCAGVPTEHVFFTRAAAMAGAALPPEAVAGGMRAQVLAVAGNPEQWGAGRASENIFEAGITQAQGFLPAVAEGRIAVRPWLDRVEGDEVVFANGARERFDALLFGTGYRLTLPRVTDDLAAALEPDTRGLPLFADTFHPDLDGFGAIGLYSLVGPYFPVLELQARWIAGVWSGEIAAPSQDAMRAGVDARPPAEMTAAGVPMHVAAAQFAALLGAEPDAQSRPDLARALLFGPLSPISYRIDGPDALSDAPERAQTAAAAFGRITSEVFTPEEEGLLSAIEAAKDAAFSSAA